MSIMCNLNTYAARYVADPRPVCAVCAVVDSQRKSGLCSRWFVVKGYLNGMIDAFFVCLLVSVVHLGCCCAF